MAPRAAGPSRRRAALIRGINVGRAKRVGMADLRRAVEDFGGTDVSTLLNSGNVVFTAPAGRVDPARALERALAEDLGVPARVVVLTPEELGEILRRDPLAGVADDPSRAFVAVYLDGSRPEKLAELARRDWAPDRLVLGKRAAYLWCPNGMAQSELAETLMRASRDALTVRNRATMLKIQARLAES